MKLETTAAIAEIVSSIAIVATLAYLAIQSQQTNNMLVGNSRQAALDADIQLLSNTLDNPEITARILGLDVERVENEAMLIQLMRTREYEWFQYENGTLDRETFESHMTPVEGWLSGEIGARWWTSSQRDFDPEFADFVNAILERGSQ
jgi:hypothetical protein